MKTSKPQIEKTIEEGIWDTIQKNLRNPFIKSVPNSNLRSKVPNTKVIPKSSVASGEQTGQTDNLKRIDFGTNTPSEPEQVLDNTRQELESMKDEIQNVKSKEDLLAIVDKISNPNQKQVYKDNIEKFFSGQLGAGEYLSRSGGFRDKAISLVRSVIENDREEIMGQQAIDEALFESKRWQKLAGIIKD